MAHDRRILSESARVVFFGSLKLGKTPSSARSAPTKIDPVVITLHVRYPGDHAIDVYMRSRSPPFDVIISREDGATVWHRLQNEIIPAIALVRPLAPQEQFEITAEWDGRESSGKPVVAGKYMARAQLLVEGEPLRAPAVPYRMETE